VSSWFGIVAELDLFGNRTIERLFWLILEVPFDPIPGTPEFLFVK